MSRKLKKPIDAGDVDLVRSVLAEQKEAERDTHKMIAFAEANAWGRYVCSPSVEAERVGKRAFSEFFGEGLLFGDSHFVKH